MSRAPESATQESDLYAGAPHPRFTKTLVGHAVGESELLNAYRSEKLAHAWLIGGPEGVGKATLAWRFARFVLAQPDPTSAQVRAAQDMSVDLEAPAVRQVLALAHPDLAALRRNWNAQSKNFYSEIRVEDVRNALQLFQKSAGAGGWRICIVDSAEDLNRAGANALLKMIEEPPPRSLFLIVAHRPGQVLATIRSRCRRLTLDGLAPSDITQIIGGLGEPWAAIPQAEANRAAARANGSVREALKRLDPAAGEVGALIEAAIARLPDADFREIHKLADAVSARGAGDAFDGLMNALYDWLAARAKSGEQGARLASIAEVWDKIRAATRETESYNLDKKLHVLSVFAELSAVARRL
ncbi:DNA polymerase III subunit delta' [Methylocapsa sp. S129]|uniref:DNA polymerase III subunit delta' n=1 Tax=Methylocapsa sp. S129 TaxID=1641869 RepID=UPI00131B2CD5|nr:DNA polymerase III subunit delta' [Methylocapsa sp. S129]